MPPLSSDHRKLLEKTVIAARIAGVKGATEALHALAVGEVKPFDSMSEGQRDLRRRLRARGRQLGDVRAPDSTQTIRRLTQEIAYEHWHRMLFARFLAENQLLIEPDSRVAISIDEVEELAREEGVDPRELSASYAQRSLPQIFRTDDPVFELTYAPETRVKLDQLLDALPPEVFTGDDALGWVYQFWQSAEKDEVNNRVKSGEKITGETLPAVTQLFTEHYMVQFLLHNTIGAWHAGKTLTSRDREGADSEQALRDAVMLTSLGGYGFEYLRFVREANDGEDLNEGTGPWRPAAGTYDGWPKTAAELRVLDPCCGSGHFLVAALELLVRLRIAEEDLDTEAAIRAVLADNLFGLELDPRCTQIAAFNLAFAAWKLAGRPIDLPTLNVACSGLGPQSTKDEWLKMAKAELAEEPGHVRQAMERGLEHMHELFSDAPELGSLIDPSELPAEGFAADFETIKPLLDRILAAEAEDDEAHERAVAARGMAAAAEILAGDYTLIATNVPYLKSGYQSSNLKSYCVDRYPHSKNDIATTFLERWLGDSATFAAVMPQSWLFMQSYKDLRDSLLARCTWRLLARLGSGAFETIGGEVVNVCLIAMDLSPPHSTTRMCGIDVSESLTPSHKAYTLVQSQSFTSVQSTQRMHPDSRISFAPSLTHDLDLLGTLAQSHHGLTTGDLGRFVLCVWEFPRLLQHHARYQRPPLTDDWDSGREYAIVNLDCHDMQSLAGFRRDGSGAWGTEGLAVSTVNKIRPTWFDGDVFDQTCTALIPHNPRNLPSLWAYANSEEFSVNVRSIDQCLKITNRTFEKIPFDRERWQTVAAEKYPDGLPEPQSDDPTQWLFHGHPERAEAHAALQVGVARLLGYRWPAELDEDMRLAPEARDLVNRCAELADHADDDGIVCLTPLRGEASAADRLRALLRDAFGDTWNRAKEQSLLAAAGEFHKDKKPVMRLDEWLREKCFEHHCKLFHHRPFVWHIWDGRKDGFSALVNYHKLAGPDGQGNQTLRTLTYAYLRDWITRQEQEVKDGKEGADARLAAAQKLKDELEKILKGEPPCDLFIRWKALHEQPIGWEPDINDGVRLNIRPFLNAENVGKKGAGVLRWKPNVKWTKDRGKEPQNLRPRERFPWFWSWDEKTENFGGGAEFDGARWNDLHYTLAHKRLARAEAEQTEGSTT